MQACIQKMALGGKVRQSYYQIYQCTPLHFTSPLRKKVSWASRAGCCCGWKRASKFQNELSTKLLVGISTNLRQAQKYHNRAEGKQAEERARESVCPLQGHEWEKGSQTRTHTPSPERSGESHCVLSSTGGDGHRRVELLMQQNCMAWTLCFSMNNWRKRSDVW